MTRAGQRLARAVRLAQQIEALRSSVTSQQQVLQQMALEVREELVLAKADVLEAEATHMDPHPGARAVILTTGGR